MERRREEEEEEGVFLLACRVRLQFHNLEAGDEAAARGILQGGGGRCILGFSLSSSPSLSFSLTGSVIN